MNRINQTSIDQFNRNQKDYFERTIKRTMLPTGSPYQRRQVEELLRLAKVSPGERMLDVGCGMGRYTLILADLGIDVTGLDLSPVLLERLQEYAGEGNRLPLYCADILNPPEVLHDQFDVVAGFFTLHHLHDIAACFTSMVRLLKPGGRIVFLEPNAFNPLYYLQIAITPGMTWQGDRGIKEMRKSKILPAMRNAGLSNLTVKRFGFFPPFLANQPWGSKVEQVLEGVPVLRPLLPFQLFLGWRE